MISKSIFNILVKGDGISKGSLDSKNVILATPNRYHFVEDLVLASP